MNNPFEPLVEMYDEQLKSIDESGSAEMFKKAADAIFESHKKNGFTVEDVQGFDGYFIVAHGTNSIVHYHIKECPGWKFGIWFDLVETSDNPRILPSVRFDWFAQYEKNIDKFKPSASNILETGRIEISKNPMCFSADCFVTDNLIYIRDHPQLAWYRDLYDIDYNLEYVSEEKAIEEFKKAETE